MLRTIVTSLAILMLSAAAHAEIRYVDGLAECPGSGTIEDPFCSINEALAEADDGDEVVVAPGTYYEQIRLWHLSVTLRSSGGAAVTIIDGGSLCRAASNTITFTFEAIPPAFFEHGRITAFELLDDCSDHGLDISDGFDMTYEDNAIILTDTAGVLEHGQWYSFRSSPPWTGNRGFELQLVVAVGDANGDGNVMFDDLSLINSSIPSFQASPDTRLDINDDGRILPSDLSAANMHVPYTAPDLPCP